MKKYFLIILSLIVVISTVIVLSALLSPPTVPPAASFTVSLSVRVDALADNLHLLEPDKRELVPEDGIIFPETIVVAYEGESVFDVIQREIRNAGIHMVTNTIPGYNLSFIEGIGNIFTFDAGPMSGWLYSVNGESADVAASQFILNPGDVIEWEFTLDFSEGW